MKVYKKSDYALRALMTLASKPGGLFSIREIAEENNIPKRFLEHIMLDMKNKGWVKGIPGRDGGYILALNPTDINMGMVIRLFDGMLAPISCVSIQKHESCSQKAKCRFRRFFLEIRNHTAQMMNKCTLKELLSLEPVESDEIGRCLFEGGAGI